MVIACKHVAFRKPESKASQPFEPGEKRIPAPDVASHVVLPRNMPNGVGRDQAFKFCAVARSKRVGGSRVSDRVGMFQPHNGRLLKPLTGRDSRSRLATRSVAENE